MSVRSRIAVAVSAAALASGGVASATPAVAASPSTDPVAGPVAGQSASSDDYQAMSRCLVWRRTTSNYSGNTAGYSWAWEVTVSPGATGDRVKEIQCLLDWWGAYGGAFDGQYGPGTTAGVKEVQARCRIGVDGVVGPQTWRCIRQGGPV
jgi:Putative peptidoglycan binding domain